MNKLIAASAIAIFAAGPAFAADPIMPAPTPTVPVVDESSVWDGFYAGLNAGYGWGEFDIDGLDGGDLDGWYGGGQVGYNLAIDGIVLGVEGDYQYSDINWTDSTDIPPGTLGFPDGATIDSETGIEHFGTVRARVGVDAGNFMPYLTAGVAFGELGGEITDGVTTLSADEYAWGLAAGAGVEAMMADNISVKAEYLYVGFQDVDFDGFDVDAEAHTVRIGFNYHF